MQSFYLNSIWFVHSMTVLFQGQLVNVVSFYSRRQQHFSLQPYVYCLPPISSITSVIVLLDRPPTIKLMVCGRYHTGNNSLALLSSQNPTNIYNNNFFTVWFYRLFCLFSKWVIFYMKGGTCFSFSGRLHYRI